MGEALGLLDVLSDTVSPNLEFFKALTPQLEDPADATHLQTITCKYIVTDMGDSNESK